MSILALVVILIVVGILVWAVDHYLQIAQPFKGIVIVLLILFGCLLLLKWAGLLGSLRV